ncbi:MAG: SDR family oxidoreductase [Halomonas sp.]|nr:SDR family oxidoreductase [Halomonas sp.]MBL1266599.1 SDR family oxidoreductase [Halomonas sp.]
MNIERNDIAVITGGGSGLGKAFGEEAARRGMRVVIADIEKDSMKQTVEELREQGATAIGVHTDVTDSASVEALSETVADRFGIPNLVFNNAGVASGGPIWESTEKDWKWVCAVNVDGVANGVRTFTPRMLEAAKKDPRYKGCVVNTASMAGLVTAPGMGIYSVSKHAVIALSECLYHDLELMGDQVTTAVLCPSYVTTNISQSYRNRPADLANDKGPTKAQLATQAISSKDLANGSLSAAEVARITFEAIGNGRFYIYPSPELLPIVKNRLDHIAHGTNPDIPYDEIPMFKERRDQLQAALSN